MSRRGLSIVIPAYNEAAFIERLLEKIQSVDLTRFGLEKEIIVVDDCSRDDTAARAAAVPGVRVHRQPANGGKGSAVRQGIAMATEEFVIIQDADLEYDPRDYAPMLDALLSGRADIVYGSRYLKHPTRGALVNALTAKHPSQSWTAFLGGQSLSLVAWGMTGRYLTDTVTALKLFRRELLVSLRLETSGFELDHEISAKALARGQRIAEVPIRYYPRSRAEGKKIGLGDWFLAIETFWRFRRG
jgi:glycosyltransferase involved in cell wall biosynthesis